MKKRTLQSAFVLTIILVILSLGFQASHYGRAAEVTPSGAPYPRLGMWWLDPYEATPEEMARYDLLLQGFDNEWMLADKYEAIQEIHPSQITLKPLSPSERQLFITDWETGITNSNPEISTLPSSFFLLQTGTRLASAVGTGDTVLEVESLVGTSGEALFEVGGYAALGEFESVRIVDINEAQKTLLVERGYVRQATAHDQGESIASHLSFWPGSWVMNVTDACPRVEIGNVEGAVNWIEYYFSLITSRRNEIYLHVTDNADRIMEGITYDGFVIDRFEDKESWLAWITSRDEISLDLYQNGEEVSAEEFDESWRAGTDLLQELIETSYPDAIIIRNNPLTVRMDPYDGQVYEYSGWSEIMSDIHGDTMDTGVSLQWYHRIIDYAYEEYYSTLPYLSWWSTEGNAASGFSERIVLFEVYEDEQGPEHGEDGQYQNPFLGEDFVPDYQKMRFTLATALLGNGYYSYEINTNGHGALGLLWFDEYDNAGEGKGYLGYPMQEATALDGGVYQREFEYGLVLVNPTYDKQTVTLEQEYRKIKGEQVPEINTGETVTVVVLAPMDGIILLKGE